MKRRRAGVGTIVQHPSPIRLDLYGFGWTYIGRSSETRPEVGWTHSKES